MRLAQCWQANVLLALVQDVRQMLLHQDVCIPLNDALVCQCNARCRMLCPCLQVRKLAPQHLSDAQGSARHAHVTCANFSRQGEIVATYNDEVRHQQASKPCFL